MAGEAKENSESDEPDSAEIQSVASGSGNREARRRIDVQTCCYVLVFCALVGSIVWFEWFGGSWQQVQRLFASEVNNGYRLPEFLSDRANYPAESQKQLEQLEQLEAREPEVSYAQRIMDWEERVALADKLLAEPLTESDYHDTLVSKVYSLVNLTETRNLRSREMMLAAIEEYREHPDDEVRKLVLIGDVEIGFIDCLKTPDASAEPALQRTVELLESFPNDETVGRFLDTQALMLVGRKKYEVAVDLLRRMRESFKDSNLLSLTNLAAAIPDRILFIEIRFDEALERMQTNKEGADAFFLDCLAKLAANPEAGPQAFRQILDAALFYEQTGRFLNAKDIYQLLEREMSRNRDPLIARSSQEAAERGQARMDSLGKEVSVQGALPDGKEVGSESLRGQFVVLYFWRSQLPAESYQAALELNAIVRNYRDAGVVFLGIGVDSDTTAQAEAIFKKVPNWHLQMAEHLGTVGKLEVELGIPKAPYVTILDKEGKVCAINVSPLQLKNQLDGLLGRRPERVPFQRSSGSSPPGAGRR